MRDEQVKHMVDRFLCWPVPSGWSPDGGISYAPWVNPANGREDPATGTNLFDANQAEAMVRHMTQDLPDAVSGIEYEEEIERSSEGVEQLLQALDNISRAPGAAAPADALPFIARLTHRMIAALADDREDLHTALAALMQHSGIADAAPEDKLPEDHAAESAARAALEGDWSSCSHKPKMTEHQIRHLVRRFLSWQAVQDFYPDPAFDFDPRFSQIDERQAEAMIRHIVDCLPEAGAQ